MQVDGRTLSHEMSETIRRMAVERVREGERPSAVIKSYGLCRTTIYKWLRASSGRGKGLRALASRKATGRPRTLTAAQERQVFRWINGKDPHRYGFDYNLWTRPVVAELIEKKFGARLGLTAVGALLARLGLTPQKPKKRSVERNEGDIVRWKNHTWPAKNNERNEKGRELHLVFIDECGFMLAPLVRRTWAPRGRTPVIRIAEPHGRISTIGAITISPARSRFGFHFCLLPDNANFHGGSIVAFVDSLRRRIRKPLMVIWDRIPIHQSSPVEQYLSDHEDVLVEPFPPYSPELNPVDYVWGYVKYGRLANYCPNSLDELRRKVTSELCRVRTRPDLLKSFFRATGLQL